jgi:hypothetical protein
MKFKTLSILLGCVLGLSTQNSFAICTPPYGKTYSGLLNGELYYIGNDGTQHIVWGEKYAFRWVFSPSSTTAANQTVKVTGYAMNASDGGHAIATDGTKIKVTYTFSPTTCSGVIKLIETVNNVSVVNAKFFYQVAGSGTNIYAVNQITPSSFTPPTNGKVNLLSSISLTQE